MHLRACLLSPLVLLTTAWGAPADLPTIRHHVGGLAEPVEILVDRWGVGHIYAPTIDAAFFGQGFNAARDRLWQIDLWRKRGLGELARELGPAFAEQDRANRLYLYRGDMRAEWIAYSSDAKRLVESFVAGINAYVALVRAQPDLLPPEFQLLQTVPAFWRAEDIVRIRSHGLANNLASEVARARVAAVADVSVDALRRRLEPVPGTRVPEGLNPADIPEDVLKVYSLARAPVTFTAEKLRGVPPPARTARAELEHALDLPLHASNNFAIAPARSVTGRALFANDPHRVQGVPALRYFSHVSAPGFDVIGAGEPFLPGISLGHNGQVAFGLTIFPIDQEDLYVYETNPEQPGEYRYLGRWEPFRVLTETLAVKAEAPRTIELKFTRHGPVVYEDPVRHRAYVTRVAWLEPGMAPYLSSLEYLRAKNWDEFLAAMNRAGLPSLNYLYADRAGNIGWAPSGLAPIRPNWDGLVPVPGDGRYEWQGFRPMDQMPRRYNPPEGWLGTSNEFNLPPNYDHAQTRLSFEWADPARMMRQHQIFGGTARLGVKDVIAAQSDVVNVTGQRATALLAGVNAPAGSPAAAALAALRSWDHRSERESTGAAVFNVWFHKHVRPAVVRRLAPPAAVGLLGDGDSAAIIDLLENPGDRLGAEPGRARDELFLTTLEAAAAELSSRLGSNPAEWRWGKLHHAMFNHPLADAFPDSDEVRRFNVGPVSKAGDAETLGRSAWRSDDFRLTNGASARFVADVGNWDNSFATNSPGQSGDPRSPHYSDLFEDWAHDRYFPLLYSRAAVEKAAEARIILTPAGGPR